MFEKIIKGDIFYKKEDEKIYYLRVINIEEDNIKVKDSDEEFYVTEDELLDNYIRLNPQGYISFNILEMEDDIPDDILISLYKRNDLIDMEKTPALLFRALIGSKSGGMCILRDITSSSKDVYSYMNWRVKELKQGTLISYYLKDTIDDLIYYLGEDNTKLFDIVLDDSFKDYLNKICIIYDIHTVFNILDVGFKLDISEDNELDFDSVRYIEEELECEMFKTYVIKYGNDVNLNKIERNHILVYDKDNELYVVAYDKGSYIKPEFREYLKQVKCAFENIPNK